MKRPLLAVLLLACSIAIPSLATAAQIKAYVAEFAVSPPDSGTLKTTLQTLLSSRLASETVTPVATAAGADLVISPSYTQLGKVFSLDAVAKLASGKIVATVYEQGESQDDLIPALGRISTKLRSEVLRFAQEIASAPAQASIPAAPVAAPAAYPAAPVAAPAAYPAAAANAYPAQTASQAGTTVWLSQRLPKALMGLIPGQSRAEGREYFLADSHTLHLYRQGKDLKQLAEFTVPLREKIIAIDAAAPDKNGNPRVYVTIMDGEAPASRIFSVENGALKLVASNLPYLFRGIALNGGKSSIYAQQMGLSEDFFGDVYEVSEVDGKVELKNPIKMPHYGNIFNFNRLTGPDGKNYVTVFSTDGYLVVYSDAGEELWRSNDKFGGSETFFQRETGASVKDTGEKLRWRFIDQRITVTSKGEVIVPQNSGFFVLGNNRSYSKYSLSSFAWNGSSLEERWKTKQSQNYLADYYLDQDQNLVLLEVVQKEGVFSKGASVIRVIKAD